jgi:DNA excision repair protein ERCC-2
MSVGNKAKKGFTVAVKTLVEFAAKQGSLDRRFTPAPTGQEGIEGHKRVTSNRPKDYQTEISLNIGYKSLTFRGRADGFNPSTRCIEEIKTFYGDVNAIPENHRALHWAQARCYGWMLCTENDWQEITLALIYFDLRKQQEHRFEQVWSADNLHTYCQALAEKYYQWQTQINERIQQRNTWIDALTFPYATMHSGQRAMAEAVYKAAATGRVVLAQAPTGTGKTLAALFPAIKAMTRTPVDKIFYLTAKTTGKHLALDNIAGIISDAELGENNKPALLRTLELTAKEKSCLAPDKQCQGSACPYALDFYTKLDAARQAAYQYPILDKATLAELAQQFQICPFYLSMEMARWVDIVVADVNYYFDGTPLLLGLTKEFDWQPYLLIDESHNLIDRARQMYSAELDRGQLLIAKKQAPAPIKKSLTRINQYWLEIIKSLTDKEDKSNIQQDKLHLIDRVPYKFSLALVDFTNTYVEWLQNHPDQPVQNNPLQEFFFSALHYQTVAEYLDDHFCLDMQNLSAQPGTYSKEEILMLRNLIPARPLNQRLQSAHCACYFSATLNPPHYYQTLLGLPEDTVYLNTPSPFAHTQLQVHIAHKLSTRYKHRAAAIAPICKIIQQQITEEKGNALVFFSSYEFLQQVEQQLRAALNPDETQLIIQSKNMSEADRQEFIQQFSQHNNLLGLAVLGGAFSEGIDLTGDALKGAFIATLGLPQVNSVNEHLRQVMQTQFNRGYDFTYTYPGIQKVIQAAGRVIRTNTDTGYLWLLDQRFGEPEVLNLLPEWWSKDS